MNSSINRVYCDRAPTATAVRWHSQPSDRRRSSRLKRPPGESKIKYIWNVNEHQRYLPLEKLRIKNPGKEWCGIKCLFPRITACITKPKLNHVISFYSIPVSSFQSWLTITTCWINCKNSVAKITVMRIFVWWSGVQISKQNIAKLSYILLRCWFPSNALNVLIYTIPFYLKHVNKMLQVVKRAKTGIVE